MPNKENMLKNSDIISDNPKKIESMRIRTLVDKVKFIHILLIWTSIIVFFGFIYHFFNTSTTHLYYNIRGDTVTGIMDAIYFSFITATSTGYGDIVPLGAFKLVVVLEVVFGVLLLAVVTTKLVSLKQDIVLSEIYEISFHTQVHRLKSSLLMFRQNLTRMIGRIEDEKIRRKELSDIYSYVSPIELIITEVQILLTKGKNAIYFTKKIDPMTAELLLKNILQSFEMINDLVKVLNNSKFDWKKDLTHSQIEYFISLNEVLFEKAESSRIIPKKNMIHLKAQKTMIINALEKDMQRHRHLVKHDRT